MFNIGDVAPDFMLTADDGSQVTLSDLRGQRVLLFFYPKANTGGCTRQACGFRDNWELIQAAGTTIFGLSPDQPEANAKWKAKEGFPYLLLSDPDQTVSNLYGVWGEKSLYGNKYMGIIRSHFIIDAEGNFEDVQFKISPKKSVEKAIKVLKK